MNKLKLLFFSIISFFLVFILVSCGSQPESSSIYVSLNNAVFEENADFTSYKVKDENGNDLVKDGKQVYNYTMNVYRVFNNGNITQISRGGDGYRIEKTRDSANENLLNVKVIDKTNEKAYFEFQVIENVKKSTTTLTNEFVYAQFEPFKRERPNLAKPQDFEGNRPIVNQFIFKSQKGYSFDFSNIGKTYEIEDKKTKTKEKFSYMKLMVVKQVLKDGKLTFVQEEVSKDIYESLNKLGNFRKKLPQPEQSHDLDRPYALKSEDNKTEIIYNYHDYNKALYQNEGRYELTFNLNNAVGRQLTDNNKLLYKLNIQISGGDNPVHKNSFGWFDYITVSWMSFFMSLFSFGGYFGLGIILFTLIIRTLLWPVYARSTQASSRMQEAQPELTKLQKKYAGKTDKDSQMKMRQEMSKIYKKHKIGLSNMLLPLLQMPIFIGVYQTVRRITIPGGYYSNNLTNLNFLGIDLGPGQNWVNFLLSAIVGISMLLIQLISMYKPKQLRNRTYGNVVPTDKNMDPKKGSRMMITVSIILTVMMVYWSYNDRAMAFYWIVGNFYTLFQTSLFKHRDFKRQLKKRNEELI